MNANQVLTLVIAGLAVIVPVITYWYINQKVKLSTTAGKDAMITKMNINGTILPIIKMNLCFINNGGKTDTIDDVKINVELSGVGTKTDAFEFSASREFTDLQNDSARSTEVMPIVVGGQSSTIKRYGFVPTSKLEQAVIPEAFQLYITIYIKIHGKWKEQKTYKSGYVSGVWNDFEDTLTANGAMLNLEVIK